MSRAETTLVRVLNSTDEKLVASARQLGVSKAALLTGLATWLDVQRGSKLPADLVKAINEADRDAGRRHADGAQRGRDIRSAQAAKRLPIT
jgi:hypothetical protein